jgi:hypothetical protein
MNALPWTSERVLNPSIPCVDSLGCDPSANFSCHEFSPWESLDES